jgi:hypothetical protein
MELDPGATVRRARGALAGLLALATLAAGCDAIPSTGAVVVQRTLDPAAGTQSVSGQIRVDAAGPQPGADPVVLVEGFLQAEGDSSQDYLQAHRFLIPAARWTPGGGVQIYDDAGLRLRAHGPATVEVTAAAVGRLDAQGDFVPESGRRTTVYHLARSGGQWRLSALPPGLEITSNDLLYNYFPADVYYYAPDMRSLVPETVYLPSRQVTLPTELVDALLAGPDRWLAPAVVSPVPAGTTMSGSAVLLGGTVSVDLDLDPTAVPLSVAARIVTQFAATLGQLPTVTEIRLTAQGQPLILPGGAAQIVSPARAVAAEADSRTSPGPVSRPTVPGASALAASTSGQQAVVVHGHVLRTVRGHWRRVRVRGRARCVAFGPGGSLWIGTSVGLDRMTPQGRVVPAPGLAGVTAVAVAPDGVRIAAATVRGLVLAVIGPKDQLASIRRLAPTLRELAGVAWAGADTVDVLAASAGTPVSLYEVSSDGAVITPVVDSPPLTSPPTALAAAAGQPVLLASGGDIWEEDPQTWVNLGPGTLPAYPAG